MRKSLRGWVVSMPQKYRYYRTGRIQSEPVSSYFFTGSIPLGGIEFRIWFLVETGVGVGKEIPNPLGVVDTVDAADVLQGLVVYGLRRPRRLRRVV